MELPKNKNWIFIAGNGGSASTADHLANDLIKMCGIKAYSLCSNVAVLSAYANDNGYENCFVDQLKVLMSKDDFLITISTSGKSMNLIKAIDYARSIGAEVMEFPIYPGVGVMDSESRHSALAHEIIKRGLEQ